MTTHHWQLGPARCKSEDCIAEILATDMGGDKPLLIRYRYKNWCSDKAWSEHRLYENGSHHVDPMYSAGFNLVPPEPPKLTRYQVIKECYEVAVSANGMAWHSIEAALDHYDKLRADGRIA